MNFDWKSNIDNYKFKNGTTLYGIKDNSVPIVFFQLIFKFGSLAEDIEKKGITFLLCQMLMKGNKQYKKEVLNLEIDKIGATINVVALHDYVAFFGKVPKEYFNDFIEIINKIIFSDVSFDKKELSIVKSKAEDILLNIKDDDNSLCNAIFSNVLFKNKSYGLISSGNRKTLNSITIDELNIHLKKLKESQNIIALAGDYCDIEVNSLEKMFGNINKKENEFIPQTDIHTPVGYELYYYNKKDRTQTQILTGQPSVGLNDKNIYSLILFNKYFGADFTSVLAQEIREKRGWSYYAQSDISLYKNMSLFTMEYGPTNENVVESFDYFKKLFTNTLSTEINKENLEFPVRKLRNSYYFKFSTIIRKLNILIDSVIYNYPLDFYNVYIPEIEKISPQEFKINLNKTLSVNNQIVVMVGNVESYLKELKAKKIFNKITKVNNIDFLKSK